MSLSLRPMTEADLPLVDDWLRLPHVARWWRPNATAEAGLAKYRERIRGGDRSTTHMLIVSSDGVPIGWCQWYLWADHPVAADEIAASGGEAGIDYAIGDPARVGHGIGTALIAALVAEVRRHHPGAGILVDPDAANTASRRVLEKNGFQLVAVRPVAADTGGPRQAIYRLPARPGLAGIVGEIQTAPAPDGMVTRIVAVDGPGGAGKSTLAAKLAEALGGAAIVPTDDFASWDNPLDWWPRLIEQVLQPLAANRAARYQRYDWDRRELAEWHVVPPAAYLVLEGVSASRQAFRPYLAYSIWVETPRAERLRRGLERDGEELRAQWEQWMTDEDAYVEREQPQRSASVIVSGSERLES